MERMPQVEKPVIQEKSRDELYFDTLKAKRDVLSSHYTLGQLRRGKKVEEMSDADREDYKEVKVEYDKRRELFLASFSNLSEEDGQKVAELTSLVKVEIELSKLEKPAEVNAEVVAPEAMPAPAPVPRITPGMFDEPAVEEPVRQTSEDVAGEARIHPDEVKSEQTKELEDILAEKYRILHQEVTVIDRRPLEEEIRALEAELEAEKQRPEAELLERQEAEANPDRLAPKGFMQRARDAFEKAKDAIMGSNRISGGSESVESRMSPLGLRHEPLSPVAPNEEVVESAQPESAQPETIQPEVAPKQIEKEPVKESFWGWLKERGRGVRTPFAFREFHQAEIFRSKTKEVANDTEALATVIQQERNLSLEEAQAEAQEIEKELKKNNIDGIGTAEFYQANSNIISERKRKENDEEIEYIIKSSGNDLLDKLAKYRGEAGQDVLTQENKLAFQADLRGELNKLRDGAMRKDFVNFAKLMRRNLDENWNWRYVWGATEALVWVGVGWASLKFLASKEAAAVAAKAVAGGAGGTEAAKKFVETGMHENVWNTLKGMAENGPNHFTPTGEQLKEWSQAVLDSIKHYEPEWINNAVEGLKSSRTMPGGTILKIPLEITKAMGY